MSHSILLTPQIIAGLNIDFWRKLGYYEDFQQFIFKSLLEEPCTQQELLSRLEHQLPAKHYRLLKLVIGELLTNMLENDELYLVNTSKQLQVSRSLKDKILLSLQLKQAPKVIHKKDTPPQEIKEIHLAGEEVIKPQSKLPKEDRSKPAPITGLRMDNVISNLGAFSLTLPVLHIKTGIADYQLLPLLEVMKTQDLIKQKELNYELGSRGIEFYRMPDDERINILKLIAKRINAEHS